MPATPSAGSSKVSSGPSESAASSGSSSHSDCLCQLAIYEIEVTGEFTGEFTLENEGTCPITVGTILVSHSGFFNLVPDPDFVLPPGDFVVVSYEAFDEPASGTTLDVVWYCDGVEHTDSFSFP